MTAAEHTIALFKSPQVTVAARSDHIDFAAVFHHARKPGLLKPHCCLITRKVPAN